MDITELQTRLGRKFRGASLDDMQGITNYSVYKEAASNLLSKIDPYETVRHTRFSVFQDILDYAAPDDLKGKKIIDLRPQDNRAGEDYYQTFTKEFDRDREIYKTSVEYIDGNKVIRLKAPGKGSTRVDQTESTTEWTLDGVASGITVDKVIRLDNSDSFRFDAASGTTYIEAGVAAAMTQLDLSAHEDISSFFRKVYIPSGASTITSLTLRIGSASGAYWEITGEIQFGSWKNGVNIVRFDWEDATETGTPDSENIDYERLTFVTTAAIADVRVGPLYSKLAHPYEIPYYSSYLFTDSTGATWKEAPTAVEDLVVLEKEAENIFFYECCVIVAEDLSMDEDAVKFRKKLGIDEMGDMTGGGLYGDYKGDKPGEALRPQNRYMTFRRSGRSGHRIKYRE